MNTQLFDSLVYTLGSKKKLTTTTLRSRENLMVLNNGLQKKKKRVTTTTPRSRENFMVVINNSLQCIELKC